MNDSNNIISINVLDRSYKIKCAVEEALELQEAARYVDAQMRKLRHNGSITSTDQIAVVTALNICHELMLHKKQKGQVIEAMNQKISGLSGKIHSALALEEELAV